MGQTESSFQAYRLYQPSDSFEPRCGKVKNKATYSTPLSNDRLKAGLNRLKAETKPKKIFPFAGKEENTNSWCKEPELAGPSSECEVSPRNEASKDDEGDTHEMFGVPINKEYLDVKSQDDFRMSYLRKLSQQKVLVPVSQRPPKSQSVMIFDWDDTLLCTSYLQQHHPGPTLSPVIKTQLKAIERVAKRLLELAMQMGETYIITNAMHGWVEYSAQKYVPGLMKVLNKVKIISARSRYECLYPGQVQKWKVAAFMDLQRQYDSHIITNLNSLGDSNYEMDATRIMGKEFEEAMVKTVKFQENPNPDELYKQLELVVTNFERIVESAKNMKVSLERRPAGEAVNP